MIHSVTILQDGQLLKLNKNDVILIDDKTGDVELYRPLDQSYASILPVLLEQGLAQSSLNASALLALVAALPSHAPIRSELAPRSGQDRRHHSLKLEA